MMLLCLNPGFDLLTDDPCLDEPCENNGTCTVAGNVLGFECNCTSEYIGFNCGTLKGVISIFLLLPNTWSSQIAY